MTGETHYTYDVSNRLLEETGVAEKTTYSYDARGNITGKRTENIMGTVHSGNTQNSGSQNSGTAVAYSYCYSLIGLLETVDKNGERVQQNIYDAENYRV